MIVAFPGYYSLISLLHVNFLNKAIGIINFAMLAKFCRRPSDLFSQYNVALHNLLQLGLPELEFYGDFTVQTQNISEVRLTLNNRTRLVTAIIGRATSEDSD